LELMEGGLQRWIIIINNSVHNAQHGWSVG